MCRNEFELLVPGAWCLVESENSEILAEAMRCIYQWSEEKWKMQYPLTDSNLIKKVGVRKAFEKEGHIKNHLLCTVYTKHILQCNFKSEDDKQYMNTYGK